MDRMSKSSSALGLGLIELLLVTAIVAVLLAVTAPALQGTVQGSRLDAAASELLNAIQLARAEALMRNSAVSICPSDMARTGVPRCAGNYANGWIVFANADRDAAVQPGDDVVLRVFAGLPRGLTVTDRSGTRLATSLINYLPDGSAHRNLTLQVCPPHGVAADSLSVVLNIVGRARLERNWGSCPEVT